MFKGTEHNKKTVRPSFQMHEITVTSSGRGLRPISGSGYKLASLAVGPIVNEFLTRFNQYHGVRYENRTRDSGITTRGFATKLTAPCRNTLDLRLPCSDQPTFNLQRSCVQFRVFLYGATRRIRTSHPCVRSTVLYPNELWSLIEFESLRRVYRRFIQDLPAA